MVKKILLLFKVLKIVIKTKSVEHDHPGSSSYYLTDFATGPISNVSLKDLRKVDQWSSLSLCLTVRGLPVTFAWAVLVQLGWVCIAL